MNYQTLKHVHMALAALSGSFFLLRGLWMLARSPMLQRGWVKSLPHLVDSLLLASALGLAFWSAQSPFERPWLGAKILALVAYILFGALALTYGRTPQRRLAALIAALCCFAYILATAVSKNPLFFLP